MSKPHQKCVRLSSAVLDFVNSFEGNGFNDKFENMVLYYETSESSIKREILRLEKEKDALHLEVDKLTSILGTLKSIDKFVRQAATYCANAPIPGQQAM